MKPITVIVKTNECMNLINTLAAKTNGPDPTYTINGLDFKVEYKNQKKGAPKYMMIRIAEFIFNYPKDKMNEVMRADTYDLIELEFNEWAKDN